jgi:xanthine/CO dehydrogenase XdhC/CoxF family maturation factor
MSGATVEFHVMEPQLGVVQEIERDEGHSFVLQCLAHEEVMLALVEPRKRIAHAVVLQELEFVRRGQEVTALIAIGIPLTSTHVG